MSEIRKKHTGEPGNGGQFGTTPKTESATPVSSAPSPEELDEQVRNAISDWEKAYLNDDIGPDDQATVSVAVGEVADSDSPVAARAAEALADFDAAVAEELAGGDDVPPYVENEMVLTLHSHLSSRAPDFVRVDASQRKEMLRQIGSMNVLGISGGRVNPLPDGVELPVGAGYKVRVRLTPADDYTVERVYVRGGKEFSRGIHERVYADEVGTHAYYASCYNNDEPGGDWKYMG